MAYAFVPEDPAGMDRLYQAMVDRIYEDPAFHTFLLQTGDFAADATRLQDWDRQFFARQPQSKHARYVQSRLPVMSAVRNPAGLTRKILPYPYRDAGYYSFDYGPLHITMLDPGKSCAPGSPQYQWLKKDLESTPNTWKLLLADGPASAAPAAQGAQIQQLVQPLCEAYGVDICFAGQTAGHAQNDTRRTRYIAGGIQSVQKTGGTRGNHATAPSDLFYCAITVDGDTLTFQAIRPDGEIVDSFSMKDVHGVRVSAGTRGGGRPGHLPPTW